METLKFVWHQLAFEVKYYISLLDAADAQTQAHRDIAEKI